MIVNCYIDGYNFYYGSTNKELVNGWCDFEKLSNRLLTRAYGSDAKLGKVFYYTSLVKEGQERHKLEIERQLYWLCGLRHGSPSVKIVQGEHVRAKPPAYRAEKHTDVHIATDLILDGIAKPTRMSRAYGAAILISADRDFSYAVSAVISEVGKQVVVFAPPEHDLYTPPSTCVQFEVKFLRYEDLEASRLPMVIRAKDGHVFTWKRYLELKEMARPVEGS